MNLTKEQISKIMELANRNEEINIEEVTELDISKALVEIERKLNFFDVEVNFNAENKNILIVDDLELSLYQLNQLMKKIGIRSFVARNKEEAKAEIVKHNFNYLLIDLFLPDCEDGFSLIQDAVSMRESGKQNYRIIVISGTDDKQLIDKCYELGADGFVTKTENWHTDILKHIHTSDENSSNLMFKKNEISEKIIEYSLKKFNDKKIYDALIADINASILAGMPNVILNLEKAIVFDSDNTYVFAEIYRICQNASGSLMLLNPSEKIKEALASAYLEGVIPVFSSVEKAKNFVSEIAKENQ